MPEMVPSQRPSPQANQDEGLYQQQQEHHQSSQREKKNAENAEHPYFCIDRDIDFIPRD